ncbi:GNAT family N-acetyltransferase [Candidatus Leptofilum sp.]|uniref:GNAT family N-acetyltransferase n=1 Tax=Candidatus Leptofilum sp. TaxID=3241576 RepID=UPI003B5CD489
MKIPTLETDNLRLRPFSIIDTTAMHQIFNTKNVLKYFPGPRTLTVAQVQRSINRLLDHWQVKGYGLWALESRATGELVGRCGLQHITETDEVEIDFIVSPKFWGRGFATEAGQASLQYGFETLNQSLIVGIVHPENIASQRVLTKLGMQFAEETQYFGMAVQRFVKTHPEFLIN